MTTSNISATAAKGLEWPVVVVPELFAKRPNDTNALRFDRDQGLSLRPPEADDGKLKSDRHTRLGDEPHARAEAEQRRLFYVALTRARDHLVLGLADPKNPDFAKLALEAVGPPIGPLDPGAAGTPRQNPNVEEVDASALAVPPAPLPPPVPIDAAAQVAAVVQRVFAAPPPVAQRVALPVTQLQDFVLCPRRYRFAQVVGLAERPLAFTWSPDGAEVVEDTIAEMNLKIPTCYWGGEPIRVINGEESFNRDDVRTLKKWGDFLSDPAKGKQPWIDGLSQGRTWLDLTLGGWETPFAAASVSPRQAGLAASLFLLGVLI